MARNPESCPQAGLTLIELMVSLMVLAVLVTVSVPSFNTLIRNNRLYTQVNDFHLSLMRARSEAMSRVKRVTVCAKKTNTVVDPNSVACSDTGTGKWEYGWIIFVEEKGSEDAQINSGEEILEIQQALSGDNTLRGDSISVDISVEDYISYVGTGFPTMATAGGREQTGDLLLCDSRGVTRAKLVRLRAAGRPRVTEASGIASSCPTP